MKELLRDKRPGKHERANKTAAPQMKMQKALEPHGNDQRPEYVARSVIDGQCG